MSQRLANGETRVRLNLTNRTRNQSLPVRRCKTQALDIAARRIWPVALFFCIAVCHAQSSWAHLGQNGRLVYSTTSRGDRIPDFSSAGYRGGGVALPFVKSRVTVSPSAGADDTPVIQAALDKVARLPLDAHGERGAVELAPGRFHLTGTLAIHASGVVLRGTAAIGSNASVLELTGAPHLAISMQGQYHQRALSPPTWITDRYVPSGSVVIHVADASAIRPGDWLEIVKPVTPAWTHFMGMDHLVRNGKPETWVKNNIRVLRRVAAVEGNAVHLQVPLTDSFDTQFYSARQASVTRVEITGRIAEAGVENLQILAPDRTIAYRVDAEFDGVDMDNVVDSWLRYVAFVDTTDSVRIDQHAERLTIFGVDVRQHSIVTSHAQPTDFSVSGSQILFDRCTAQGDRVTYVGTQSRSEGPIVVLHCRFQGSGQLEGHQRWSTGLLVDGCEVPDGSIDLRNRGEMGSGHGWTLGWSVLWNNKASSITVQNPPGVLNWSIGDAGPQVDASMPVFDTPDGPTLPQGIIESSGHPVKPASLYLEQLRDRLGPEALAAIGYR
jgi:hypothetical protein